MMGDGDAGSAPNLEDTCEDHEDDVPAEPHHRHYDEIAEDTPPGSCFPSNAKHVNGARRRQRARLGVSRVPFIEPLGSKRESFYEEKLLLALP